MQRIVVFESIHEAGLTRLAQHFDVSVALRSSRSVVLDQVKDAVAIVVRSVTQVDADLMNQAPHLRVIGRAGTGTDNIDLVAAKERGIQVITIPEGNAVAVAEMAVMEMLMLRRNLLAVIEAGHRLDFRRELYQGRELASSTVGILGVGRIGQLVAARLAAFGCRIVGFDVNAKLKPRFDALGIHWCERLDELLEQSDILTVHVPKTAQTLHCIGAKELQQLPAGALVINSSRGGIVEEDALLKSVESGHIAGAAIDVLEEEPPFDTPPEQVNFSHPLLNHPKIIVTPHFGASTDEAQEKIAMALAKKIIKKFQPQAVGV